MPENKNNLNADSAVKRIKRKAVLKRQKNAAIGLCIAIALLIAALATVFYLVEIYTYEDVDDTTYYLKKIDGAYALCYKNGEVCEQNSDGYYQTDAGTLLSVDATNGSCSRYAVVDTYGTEVLGYSQYVLMFKQLTYDILSTKDMSKVIKSIEVSNDHGGYTFERDGNSSNFFIKNHAATPYDRETFAKLSVACGYTISMQRLENPKLLSDGSVDYSEYGLISEARTEIIVDENGNESVREYQYTPVSYVITTMTDEKHEVILGDLSVTGTGYYAKYAGRDTVYVLSSANLSETVFKPIESFVTPTIVYPMEMNNYFKVSNFIICDNIDYDSIFAELEAKYKDTEIDEEQFSKDYYELFEKYSHTVCNFSYVDLNGRINTINAYIPYVSELEYTDGYYINITNTDRVLYNLYSTSFTGVEKLSPDDDDFEKYGLDEAEYVVGFNFNTTDANGSPTYIANYFEVSKKNADGIYYAYSPTYDMIVGIDESSFEFLEWEEIKWYDPSYIQIDITNVTDVIIESPELDVHFKIDDSASKYMTYLEQSGKSLSDGVNTYNIVKNTNGKYVLACDGSALTPLYNGDYLITPLVYSKGAAENENYIFAEYKKTDVNGDGNDDAYIYYFYNVAFTGEEYVLVARVVIADFQGNKLSEDRTVLGQSQLKTDFFLTNSSYLYMTNKNSFVGKELESTYGSLGRGSWGSGNLFVSIDEKYVLVNSKTGEWGILDGISGALYLADRVNSRLAQRAVTAPTLYNSNGKVVRYGETYYPQTKEKMQYNEQTYSIEIYNSSQKAWRNMSYGDCTIGVWNKGSYYVTEGGLLVIVNEDSGEWGYVTVSTNEKYIANIFADAKLLDYNIKITDHMNRLETIDAMDNFQQFYKALLYASLEGMAELTDQEKSALKELDDFNTESAENPCQLKITIYAEDFFGTRRDTVYRIYQYTERKSYITIESVSPDDNYESSSREAYGNFYILRSFADKIIEDAKKVINEQEVVSTAKY